MPKLFHHSYDKIKLLGEGAFGSAYLVRPKELRNVFQVAKEIRISHLTDKQREGAVAESEVLRMLKHPNIIAYIDSFSEGNRMYIVMEYADGGDLAAQIKEQKDNHSRFEEREIMRIFVQLVLALIYIHSRKVLHRDLKPLNIFLTMQGIVKLGDFGIARVLDSSTAGAQTTIGTPHYLSPEMVNNEAYGTRSDLWSLGVVTYELAALRVPFGGNSLPAVAMKIMGADPDPLLDRSSDLSWIVFGLLAKDPNDRPRLEAVQRMPFVQKYIQELLCYSKETGNGGCEAMTASLERERRDRSQPSREREAESASEPGERSPARERSVRSEQSERRAEFRDARSKKTHGSFRDVQQEAAHAEFLRTRKAALDAKRRAEAENAEALQVNSRERPRWGMDEDCGAAEVEVRREKPFRERKAEEDRLSGKEREAAVKRQAQAARDELESAHLNALGKAMREHQEEKKRLALRFKRTEEVLPPPEDFEDDSPSGKEPCKDKRAEEAEYLRKLEQAREEAAEERRRLAEKVAARAADDEVSAGSGEEVDSDKENAGLCLVLKTRQAPQLDAQGDAGLAPMLLEIPFTDKVKPKPKLSSEARLPKKSADARERGRGEVKPPMPGKPNQPSRPGVLSQRVRAELRLNRNVRANATPPGRAGSPAQWLRAASCDRPQPEKSSVLEKLPATRSRPSLEHLSYNSSPAPAAPPTPQGAGDVSQLQDALAHALCGVEGVHTEAAIPEEITTMDAREVRTLLAGVQEPGHELDQDDH